MDKLTKIETPEQMARMGLNAQIEKIQEQMRIVEDSLLSLDKKEFVDSLLVLEIGRLSSMVRALT